jgi:hypothetical protein
MFTAFEVSFFIADGARGGLVGGWCKGTHGRGDTQCRKVLCKVRIIHLRTSGNRTGAIRRTQVSSVSTSSTCLLPPSTPP